MPLAMGLAANLAAQKTARAQITELEERIGVLAGQFNAGIAALRDMLTARLGVADWPSDVKCATPENQLGFMMRAAESMCSNDTLQAVVHGQHPVH